MPILTCIIKHGSNEQYFITFSKYATANIMCNVGVLLHHLSYLNKVGSRSMLNLMLHIFVCISLLIKRIFYTNKSEETHLVYTRI